MVNYKTIFEIPILLFFIRVIDTLFPNIILSITLIFIIDAIENRVWHDYPFSSISNYSPNARKVLGWDSCKYCLGDGTFDNVVITNLQIQILQINSGGNLASGFIPPTESFIIDGTANNCLMMTNSNVQKIWYLYTYMDWINQHTAGDILTFSFSYKWKPFAEY